MPLQPDTFADLIVIGDGRDAAEAALAAAAAGLRPVLGRTADAATGAGSLADLILGEDVPAAWPDVPRPLTDQAGPSPRLLADLAAAGGAVETGDWRLAGQGRVGRADGPALSGRAILLATGARPAGLPGVPPDLPAVATPATLLSRSAPPADVIVAGGGAVGVWTAGLLARCGVQVTLVGRADRLLPRLDAEISTRVAHALAAAGVAVHLSARLRGITAGPDGIVAELDDRGRGERRTVRTACLVPATGWRPRTAGLGLEHTRAVLDRRGHIQVDSTMGTAEPGLFAAGAIVPTHPGPGTAAAELAVAVARVTGAQPVPLRAAAAAHAVGGILPAAGVGLAEAEAGAMGHLVAVGRAADDVTGAFAKVVADAETGRTLGVHLAGAGTMDRLAAAQSLLAPAGPAASPSPADHLLATALARAAAAAAPLPAAEEGGRP